MTKNIKVIRGFTLIEVMIASVIVAIVTGIALTFSLSASRQASINTKDAFTLLGLTQFKEEFLMDLSQAGLHYSGDLDPDGNTISSGVTTMELTSHTITFRKIIGPDHDPDTDTLIWTHPITYLLVPAVGEDTLNDVDDNENGFTDEWRFMRIVGDGVDNDGDGLVDEVWEGYPGPDGSDNDGDGTIDNPSEGNPEDRLFGNPFFEENTSLFFTIVDGVDNNGADGIDENGEIPTNYPPSNSPERYLRITFFYLESENTPRKFETAIALNDF